MRRYKRIKELREEKQMSQTQIARILECTQVGYSRYESGQRDIPTQTLIELSRIFEASTDYILGLKEERQ